MSTIFRLWSATNAAGLPLRNATATWHQLCDCGHLDNLNSDTRGPVGMVVDSETGAPADVLDLAAKATHRCKLAAKPEPAPEPTEPPRGGWTKHQWTPEQDTIVADSTCKDAIAALGVSKSAVEWRRKQLREQGLMAPPRVSRHWTDEQDAVVLSLPAMEAAKKLGRNPSSIRTRKSMLLKQVAA